MHMNSLLEAVDLLTSKLGSAKKSMDETVENLEFWWEQATVMKVIFARVHNARMADVLCLPSPSAVCYVIPSFASLVITSLLPFFPSPMNGRFRSFVGQSCS
jgi:hypothetical protein